MAAARAVRQKALDQWWHTVASSEAPDVLHQVMHPALYRRTRKAIEIARNSPAFLVVVSSLYTHNLSQRPCYGQHKLKPNYNIVFKVLLNLFVCYGHPPLMMDFGHHFQWRASDVSKTRGAVETMN